MKKLLLGFLICFIFGSAASLAQIPSVAVNSYTIIPGIGGASPVNSQQFVVPSTTALLRRDLIPQKHLRNFSASATPIVCVSGDSTMTDGANNDIGGASGLGNFYNVLQRRMVADNPSKTITFINVAVGGSTWASFNAGTQVSTMLTDGCDTVFIGLGVNDVYNVSIDKINTAITALTAGAKVPDIILVTNKPATNNPGAGAPFNTPAWQVGAQTSASIERLMAITNNAISAIPNAPNIGLIDLGRYFTMIEYGFDPVNQYLQLQPAAVVSGISSFPYTFPTSQNGDFQADFTLVGAASGFASGAGITNIILLLSQPPSGVPSGVALQITPSGGVSFAARGFAGSGLVTLATGGTIGAANIHVIAEVHQEQLRVTVNNTVLATLYLPRPVGNFQPTLTLSGTVGSVTMNVNAFAGAISQPATTVWADAGMYGLIGGLGNNGGNGINHAASIGISSVEELVLEGTDFRGSIPAPTSDNRIINGRMELDQVQEGASLLMSAANALVIDRWRYVQSGLTNRLSFQRVADAPVGFQNSFKITVASATSPGAGALSYIRNQIDGPQITDFGFGAAGAANVCFSFWAKANNTGNYPTSLANGAGNRSYAITYPINVASVWSYESFVIPGDTGGSWSTAAGSSGGIQATFGLGSGSGSQVTPNVWGASPGLATATSANLVATASATLQITGVRLYPCSGDIPAIWRTAHQEISLAQQFYRKSFPLGTKPAQSAGVAGARCIRNPIALGEPSVYVDFLPPMAASPTITTFNPSAANANWRDVTASSDIAVAVDPVTALSSTGVEIATGGTVTTLADDLCIHYTADVGF